MVDKLEACTWCGHEGVLHCSSDGEVEWVRCVHCGRESPLAYSAAEAIRRWNAGEVRNTRATPANGEQVGREQFAENAKISTPTEDARERVKALEEALERLERVMRENIHENDGPDRIMLDGQWHEGPLAAWTIRCFRKVGEIARTALGNKETDRHG